MVENDEQSFLTREEAELLAAEESHRDLVSSESTISYIRYFNAIDDYCRVRITFDERNRGNYTIQMFLPLEDRKPDESIDNSKILGLALRGQRLNAVRLYQHLHQCSLVDAKKQVAELERLSNNGGSHRKYKAINRSRGTGRIRNGKSNSAARLSRMLCNEAVPSLASSLG